MPWLKVACERSPIDVGMYLRVTRRRNQRGVGRRVLPARGDPVGPRQAPPHGPHHSQLRPRGRRAARGATAPWISSTRTAPPSNARSSSAPPTCSTPMSTSSLSVGRVPPISNSGAPVSGKGFPRAPLQDALDHPDHLLHPERLGQDGGSRPAQELCRARRERVPRQEDHPTG